MDIKLYLERIGIKYTPHAMLEDMVKVQHAHRLSIPFENLDVRLGRGVDMADSAIFDKLVTQKRGGYCFEHNALLRWFLREIGFDVRPLLARVWLFAAETPPKTHTLNLVNIYDEGWIADAGFGSSYCPPMPLREGASIIGDDGAEHRLMIDPVHGWMLQVKIDGCFKNEFSFTLDPVASLDLEMSNHWTATSPKSRFRKSLITNISTPSGTISLNNNILKIVDRDRAKKQELHGEKALQDALMQYFGIKISIDDAKILSARN